MWFTVHDRFYRKEGGKMKTRFYLVYNTPEALHITRYYPTMEEANDNKEFLERYFGVRVRLKIDEVATIN